MIRMGDAREQRMKKPSKADKPYDKSVYRSLILITQFGINMVVPIAMMTALGVYLDKHFELGWVTVVLFFVGALAGGQNVLRMAKRIYEDGGNSGSTEKKE